MFSRVFLIFLLIFSFSTAPAQVMHIHTGEEEAEFNLADVDSITYTDLIISLSVEPESIEFGRVVIDRVRNAILTISNTGNGNLIINAIEIEEGVFVVDFENLLEIAPGQSFDLTVSFFPQEVEDFASEIIIHSNSQENPEHTINVSGSGYIPEGQVHFIYERTEAGMNLLGVRAMIGDESVVENDEIGVFTTDGLCVGGGIVRWAFPEDPIRIVAWGADEGLNNGLQAGEQMTLRIFDSSSQTEYAARFHNGRGFVPVYEAGVYIAIFIDAIIER